MTHIEILLNVHGYIYKYLDRRSKKQTIKRGVSLMYNGNSISTFPSNQQVPKPPDRHLEDQATISSTPDTSDQNATPPQTSQSQPNRS